MKKSVYNSIVRACEIGSLNLDKHCTGAPFGWHGRTLTILPLYCCYGRIGYTIRVEGQKGTIQLDEGEYFLDGEFE